MLEQGDADDPIKLCSLYFQEQGFRAFANRAQSLPEGDRRDKCVWMSRLLLVELPTAYLKFSFLLPQVLQEISITSSVNIHLLDQQLLKLVPKEFSTEFVRPLIYVYNLEFCRVWSLAKASIAQLVRAHEHQLRRIRSANRFLVYSMFKQISRLSFGIIRRAFKHSLFEAVVSAELFQEFSHKMLELLEFIDFNGEGLVSCSQLQHYIQGRHHQRWAFARLDCVQTLNSILELTDAPEFLYQKVELDNGSKGLLLAGRNDSQYLIRQAKSGLFIFTNTKYLSNSWKRSDDSALSGLDVGLLGKYADREKADVNWAMNGTLIGLTGTLGYLLSNINEYESLQAFAKHFGKECVTGGYIFTLCMQVPMFFELLVLGGLGYEIMNVALSQHHTLKAKAVNISKFVVGNGSVIGLCIGGAMLGQAAIPVPVLGGLVGCFVGGLIGGAGSSILLTIYKKEQTKRLQKYLLLRMEQGGYWGYCPELVERLGLSLAFFQNSIPKSLKTSQDGPTIWLTVLCFMLVSGSQNSSEQEQVEQLVKAKERKWYRRKLSQVEQTMIDQQIEQILGRVPLSLQKCMQFLSECEQPLLFLVLKGEELLGAAFA